MTSHQQKLEHAHESPDSWHRHTPEEGQGQQEHGAHASPKALLLTLVAMVFGTLFVVLVLMAFFRSYTTQFRAATEETLELGVPARESRAKAMGELNSWGWTSDGRLHMPIEQAMEKVVAERGGQG